MVQEQISHWLVDAKLRAFLSIPEVISSVLERRVSAFVISPSTTNHDADPLPPNLSSKHVPGKLCHQGSRVNIRWKQRDMHCSWVEIRSDVKGSRMWLLAC
jgi:hypothetical protein